MVAVKASYMIPFRPINKDSLYRTSLEVETVKSKYLDLI